ncbi:hypothetical protein DEM91_05615 [Prevotella sp. TCVGH]|nr:hypothetical protein [Prevotella sp. TCVGH]
MPIGFFYFEDFGWPFFGKLTGQKCYLESAFVDSALKEKTLSFFHSLIIRKIYLHLHKVGYASTEKVNFLCLRLAPPLHKRDFALAISGLPDCVRLVLFLHKVGCALTKKINFLCLRLALPLMCKNN